MIYSDPSKNSTRAGSDGGTDGGTDGSLSWCVSCKAFPYIISVASSWWFTVSYARNCSKSSHGVCNKSLHASCDPPQLQLKAELWLPTVIIALNIFFWEQARLAWAVWRSDTRQLPRQCRRNASAALLFLVRLMRSRRRVLRPSTPMLRKWSPKRWSLPLIGPCEKTVSRRWGDARWQTLRKALTKPSQIPRSSGRS